MTVPEQRRVLVTGATGFVGRRVVAALAGDGWQVRCALRQSSALPQGAAESMVVGDLGCETRCGQALEGVAAVVHLAARVHRLEDQSRDPLQAYRETNVEGTAALVRAAAAAEVKRFLFMSSVKVHGERSRPAAQGGWERFTADDPPAPADPYSLSKWEAEQCLQTVAGHGLEAVVLRPPLVYGPGVGANFRRLMELARRRLPLPLASVRNLRSLIHVDNLADAVRLCLSHPVAAGKTYLVGDLDVSTPELLHRLGACMHRPQRLLPMPVSWLRAAAAALGRSAEIGRLLDSLVVDGRPIRAELAWAPPMSPERGLQETVAAFLAATPTPTLPRQRGRG